MKMIPRCFLSLSLLVAAFVATGCGGSEKAKERAKAIQDAVKPGEIATSGAGFAMKAKLDGKEWVATRMMSPLDTGRILGMKGEESISLPFLRSGLTSGKTVKFGQDNAVDLMVNDDTGIWGGYSGEMTYTKVDETSAEGTFHFTATARESSKKIEVTDGTFRVLLTRQ